MSLTARIKAHPIYTSIGAALILAGVAYVMLVARKSDTQIVRPKRGPIVEAVYGIGTVTSNKQFHGRIAQANGIQQINVKEGQLVEKGTRLISLQDGVGIVAPFRGTVTAMPFFAGETVLAGTIVLTMQDLKDVYVVATLEQQGALRVRPGMRVRLNFESIRNQTFNGRVRSVFPQETQFLVNIDVDGLPENILPSMTADAAIEIARRESALLIPVGAISGGKVVVMRDGNQEKIDVQIGTTDSEWAEVTGGDLKENDQVLMPRH